MRRLLLAALLCPLAPAQAAERSYFIGDFDRIRVEGPFDVRLVTRGTPAARVTGPSAGVEIRVDSGVLVVRAAQDQQGAPASASGGEPRTIFLHTTDLHGASVIGGGKLDITGPVRGQRIDLAISGSGSIAALALDGEQVNATLVGTGMMTLGGRAATARVLSSGAGTIEARALTADSVVLRLDGSGDTRISARYAADVATGGLGAATVYGTPKCKVHAAAGGPVACGVPLPPAP